MLADRLTQTTIKLLNKYGEPVVFTYQTERIINADGSGYIGGETVEVKGMGYPTIYDKGERKDTLIDVTDIKLICHKLSERPKNGWRCVVDGVTYNVGSLIEPIRCSGKDVAYFVQLKV